MPFRCLVLKMGELQHVYLLMGRPSKGEKLMNAGGKKKDQSRRRVPQLIGENGPIAQVQRLVLHRCSDHSRIVTERKGESIWVLIWLGSWLKFSPLIASVFLVK